MYISIKDAKKQYGKGDAAVMALDGVSLGIEKSKIVVVLGPSGSGKSTLMNMLGGLDTLDEGEITVDGKVISKMSKKQLTEYRRADVGFVFQFYNLIPDLSVKENVETVSEISQAPLDLDEILSALDIEKLKNRFPKELSGGQQQRVAIARALIKNPKILLCDELTGALDTKASKKVLEFIEKINKKFYATIIIITHNEAISKMADVVIRIKDGKIYSVTQNDNKLSACDLAL